MNNDRESYKNYENPASERILEMAADISPILEKYGAGIFGGVAVEVYSKGRRHSIHDIDILCPSETINDLSKAVASHLKTDVELSPVGFDILCIEGNPLLNIEIMSCNETENVLHLPFGIDTLIPLQNEWQELDDKKVLLVSRELLREMKSKSTRDKDIRDFKILGGTNV